MAPTLPKRIVCLNCRHAGGRSGSGCDASIMLRVGAMDSSATNVLDSGTTFLQVRGPLHQGQDVAAADLRAAQLTDKDAVAQDQHAVTDVDEILDIGRCEHHGKSSLRALAQ